MSGWKDTIKPDVPQTEDQASPSSGWKSTVAPESSSKQEDPGLLNSIVSHLASGGSFNMDSRLGGALSAAGRAAGVENLGGKIKDIGMAPGGPTLDPDELAKSYNITKDQLEQLKSAGMASHPTASKLAELAGGLASFKALPNIPLGSATGISAVAPKVGAALNSAAKYGAGSALSSIGAEKDLSNPDTLPQVASNAGKAGAIGAGLGIANKVAPVIGGMAAGAAIGNYLTEDPNNLNKNRVAGAVLGAIPGIGMKAGNILSESTPGKLASKAYEGQNLARPQVRQALNQEVTSTAEQNAKQLTGAANEIFKQKSDLIKANSGTEIDPTDFVAKADNIIDKTIGLSEAEKIAYKKDIRNYIKIEKPTEVSGPSAGNGSKIDPMTLKTVDDATIPEKFTPSSNETDTSNLGKSLNPPPDKSAATFTPMSRALVDPKIPAPLEKQFDYGDTNKQAPESLADIQMDKNPEQVPESLDNKASGGPSSGYGVDPLTLDKSKAKVSPSNVGVMDIMRQAYGELLNSKSSKPLDKKLYGLTSQEVNKAVPTASEVNEKIITARNMLENAGISPDLEFKMENGELAPKDIADFREKLTNDITSGGKESPQGLNKQKRMQDITSALNQLKPGLGDQMMGNYDKLSSNYALAQKANIDPANALAYHGAGVKGMAYAIPAYLAEKAGNINRSMENVPSDLANIGKNVLSQVPTSTTIPEVLKPNKSQQDKSRENPNFWKGQPFSNYKTENLPDMESSLNKPTSSDFSRRLYALNPDELKSVMNRLSGNKNTSIQDMGKGLGKSLDSGDTVKQSAQLFSIAQNPDARKLLQTGPEGEDDEIG